MAWNLNQKRLTSLKIVFMSLAACARCASMPVLPELLKPVSEEVEEELECKGGGEEEVDVVEQLVVERQVLAGVDLCLDHR